MEQGGKPSASEIALNPINTSSHSMGTMYGHESVDSHPAAVAPSRQPVSSYTTPHDTYEALIDMATHKANHTWQESIGHAFLAGAYIGLGGLLSLMCGCMPAIKETDPGLQKLVFGAVFPVGLFVVVVTGAELFTSNVFTVSAWMARRLGIGRVVFNLSLVWVCNFAGALWLAGMVYWSGVVSDAFATSAIGYFDHKVHQSFDVSFCKGVFCNWFVALAIYLATSAHDLSGKAMGVWPPVAAFVAIGFDHCIANMFFLPLGLMIGAHYTVGEMFINNLIPVTMGNVVGSFLVSVSYAILEHRARWNSPLPAPATH
eukprot:comp21910_c0_seq1/m.31460 comp21910_c0_seq1/g.31460  ORF comp21910_c0_seq1/g.31460 comp21910_c0_seq1/m.31460 type:complete len:315 (-) comp21910_c0_seq1:264-1208(-)